jgi:hypothetical protein
MSDIPLEHSGTRRDARVRQYGRWRIVDPELIRESSQVTARAVIPAAYRRLEYRADFRYGARPLAALRSGWCESERVQPVDCSD